MFRGTPFICSQLTKLNFHVLSLDNTCLVTVILLGTPCICSQLTILTSHFLSLDNTSLVIVMFLRTPCICSQLTILTSHFLSLDNTSLVIVMFRGTPCICTQLTKPTSHFLSLDNTSLINMRIKQFEGRGGVSNSWLLVSGISKSNCFLVISTGAVHYFSSAGLKCFNFVWKLFLKLRA